MMLPRRTTVGAFALVGWALLTLSGSGLSAQNWPQFRGPFASGVAPGDQNLPDRFDTESGENVLWRTEIPGLAHASPIVWGDLVIVATAISSRGRATFKSGLYGEGTASGDRSPHRFVVQALDRRSGGVRWSTTVHEGVPIEKRHIKATYANHTPATNGEVIVAFFGSEGVFALDLDGRVRWRAEVGRLDVGAYDAPSYEWGSASSPILWDGKVIVQCDTQEEDFLLALDERTGKEIWRARRDELPSWGTPTVVRGPGRVELVTNGSNYIRGYDPNSGRELWRLGGSSQITAPTPIYAGGLIVVASGRRPVKPIFVLEPGATGDITLPEGATSGGPVVWSVRGRGPYMPTPIVVADILFVLQNQGILDAYELRTGRELYRQRLRHRGGGFSASPVAADGKLYLASEDGDLFVVAAGAQYREIAVNEVGERVMASPAIAGGVLFVRGERSLLAVGAGPAGADG